MVTSTDNHARAFEIPFSGERDAYLDECHEHYAGYPADVSGIEEELERWIEAHPDASSYAVKAHVYDVVAGRCPVKIFRHSPFYHEIVSGRNHDDWGFNGLGGWMYKRNYPDMTRHLHEQTDPWSEDGICYSNCFDKPIPSTLSMITFSTACAGVAGLIIGSIFMNLNTIWLIITFATTHAVGGTIGGIFGLILVNALKTRITVPSHSKWIERSCLP